MPDHWEWTQTGPWTYELRLQGVLLGRVVKNGFNVLAYTATDQHLGYWDSVKSAQDAVQRWVSKQRSVNE